MYFEPKSIKINDCTDTKYEEDVGKYCFCSWNDCNFATVPLPSKIVIMVLTHILYLAT